MIFGSSQSEIEFGKKVIKFLLTKSIILKLYFNEFAHARDRVPGSTGYIAQSKKSHVHPTIDSIVLGSPGELGWVFLASNDKIN